jgi:hypothetical protein
MTRMEWGVALLIAATTAEAQSLARNVLASDGLVNVIFPSRPNVCGDGQSYIRTPVGREYGQTYTDGNVFHGTTGFTSRPCVLGPERVLVTVLSGEVTRVRAFVGPVPQPSAEIRMINTSAAEAAVWLGDVALRAPSRVAAQAIRALMFADAPPPWPLMLRIARDNTRPREVRQTALTWLSTGVNDHLGLTDFNERATDDDEMRTQAVFALTQRRKEESVPELIDLARNAKHKSARKAAIFWLGQTGDLRAAEVYAELLGIR